MKNKIVLCLIVVFMFAFGGACSAADKKPFQWERVGEGESGVIYMDTTYLARLQSKDMPYIKCVTKETELNSYYLEQVRTQRGCENVEYIMTIYNFQQDTDTYRIAARFYIDTNEKVVSKLPTDGFWYKVDTNKIIDMVYKKAISSI